MAIIKQKTFFFTYTFRQTYACIINKTYFEIHINIDFANNIFKFFLIKYDLYPHYALFSGVNKLEIRRSIVSFKLKSKITAFMHTN